MHYGRSRRPGGRVAFTHAQLWLAVVLLFGVADLVATVVGLGLGALLGTGPVAVPLLEVYGPVALVGAKFGVVAGGYALWRLFPGPRRVLGPALLAVLGAGLAGWRVLVVAEALLV